jgi:hypothetical protein
MGLIEDAELEEEIYQDQEANPFGESDTDQSEKPKKETNLEDILGDTGFLEF